MSNEMPLVDQAVAQRLVRQIAALHTNANPNEKIVYASLVSTLFKRNHLMQFGFHLSEHAFSNARKYAREHGPGVPRPKPIQPDSKKPASTTQLDLLKEFLLLHSSPIEQYSLNRLLLLFRTWRPPLANYFVCGNLFQSITLNKTKIIEHCRLNPPAPGRMWSITPPTDLIFIFFRARPGADSVPCPVNPH